MELLLIPVVVFGLWFIKSIRQDLWDNACMYDPEYDMWFSNHPHHPNYKPKSELAERTGYEDLS